jgi:hypothetical protein
MGGSASTWGHHAAPCRDVIAGATKELTLRADFLSFCVRRHGRVFTLNVGGLPPLAIIAKLGKPTTPPKWRGFVMVPGVRRTGVADAEDISWLS